MTPHRIQRTRTKGSKLPAGTVCVTRPGPWGNPFTVGTWWKIGEPKRTLMSRLQALMPGDHSDEGFTLLMDAEQCVAFYRRYLELWPPRNLDELRGKNLACWCPIGSPCHGDILLELANRGK